MIFNFIGIDLCIALCLYISREFYADVAQEVFLLTRYVEYVLQQLLT